MTESEIIAMQKELIRLLQNESQMKTERINMVRNELDRAYKTIDKLREGTECDCTPVVVSKSTYAVVRDS